MRSSHGLGSLKNIRLLSNYDVHRRLIFIAVALSLAMAVFSATNRQVHHDEYDHINAARFYSDHWLPPAVGDSRALSSYSIFGMSYLNEWDVVYLIAGKFAKLVHPIVSNDAIALRLFNVGLFLILGCVALFRRDLILAFAILLTSPQIWYVFSYFNGDAFPMFLSILAAAMLTAVRIPIAERTYPAIVRYLPLAVCIGLLILSKKTFWPFALFAALYATWIELSEYRRSLSDLTFIRNLGFLAALICLITLPRIAYDFHINGTPSVKAAKIKQTAETLAAPIFKPSTSRKASLNLRGKGVGLVEMMRWPLSWPRYSAVTAFGAYNYNTVLSNEYYYRAIITIYVLFLVYLFVTIAINGDTDDKIVIGGSFVFSCLIVGLAIYHSWVNDFQPQGRYLFAIFAILAVVLARNKALLNPVVVNLFLLSCFSLSIYSFVATGLGGVSKFKDLLEISDEFRRPE